MGDFSTSAIAQRTMSDFPISIGTGLALSSLLTPTTAPYDPAREVPQKLSVLDYQEVWVNLRTLHRNLMGALPSGKEHAVMPQDLSDTLSFEVDLIDQLVREESKGRTRCVFYTSNYAGMAQAHPYGQLRRSTTVKQMEADSLMEQVLTDFFKHRVKSDLFEHFERMLEPKRRTRTLILTHYAYDLLSHRKFESLDLLESHTGVKKSFPDWHTKLSNGKELVNIPFNSFTIQLFGDSQTFSPYPIKARQAIKELAERFKWTSVSTDERIVFSLGQLSDAYAATVYKKMLNEV